MVAAEAWPDLAQLVIGRRPEGALSAEPLLVVEKELLKDPGKRRKKDRIARLARQLCGKKDTEFQQELPVQVWMLVEVD
jgi:hypothetical protein